MPGWFSKAHPVLFNKDMVTLQDVKIWKPEGKGVIKLCWLHCCILRVKIYQKRCLRNAHIIVHYSAVKSSCLNKHVKRTKEAREGNIPTRNKEAWHQQNGLIVRGKKVIPSSKRLLQIFSFIGATKMLMFCLKSAIIFQK